MQPAQLYRLAGLASLLAAGLNALVEFTPPGPGDVLNLLANSLGLWVLAALYLRQRQASGRLGFAGYTLQSFGIAWAVGFLFTQAFVLRGLDPAQSAALLAGPLGRAAVIMLAAATLGAVLFGLATWRAGVFPKGAAVLFAAGFVTAASAPVAPRLVASLGEILISASLLWLGYGLLNPERLPADRAA
jgi:hypothetical protein